MSQEYKLVKMSTGDRAEVTVHSLLVKEISGKATSVYKKSPYLPMNIYKLQNQATNTFMCRQVTEKVKH